MKYIIADKTLAVQKGFGINTHRTNKNLILLNEKEVAASPTMNGTLEDRVKELTGSIYTHAEVKHILNEGGWNEL